MLKTVLTSKLHHARVTGANPEYIGSIGIDSDLMDRVGIVEGEQVHVWAVDHRERIVTYALAADRGEVVINGGGAHRFKVGDRVIIAAFGLVDQKETPSEAKIVMLGEDNGVLSSLKMHSR